MAEGSTYSQAVVLRFLAAAATVVDIVLSEPDATALHKIKAWLLVGASQHLDAKHGPLSDGEAEQLKQLLSLLASSIGEDVYEP